MPLSPPCKARFATKTKSHICCTIQPEGFIQNCGKQKRKSRQANREVLQGLAGSPAIVQQDVQWHVLWNTARSAGISYDVSGLNPFSNGTEIQWLSDRWNGGRSIRAGIHLEGVAEQNHVEKTRQPRQFALSNCVKEDRASGSNWGDEHDAA